MQLGCVLTLQLDTENNYIMILYSLIRDTVKGGDGYRSQITQKPYHHHTKLGTAANSLDDQVQGTYIISLILYCKVSAVETNGTQSISYIDKRYTKSLASTVLCCTCIVRYQLLQTNGAQSISYWDKRYTKYHLLQTNGPQCNQPVLYCTVLVLQGVSCLVNSTQGIVCQCDTVLYRCVCLQVCLVSSHFYCVLELSSISFLCAQSIYSLYVHTAPRCMCGLYLKVDTAVLYRGSVSQCVRALFIYSITGLYTAVLYRCSVSQCVRALLFYSITGLYTAYCIGALYLSTSGPSFSTVLLVCTCCVKALCIGLYPFSQGPLVSRCILHVGAP